MSEVILSTRLLDVLQVLAAALCDANEERGLPNPCFCGVVPGTDVPLDPGGCDDAECGTLFVRLVNTYPSAQIGVQDITPGNCGAGHGFDVEVGAYRCFPLTEDGAPLDDEQLLRAVSLQLADEAMMRYAIQCSGWLPWKDMVMGMYQPEGPAGGVVGGVIPLSGWLP